MRQVTMTRRILIKEQIYDAKIRNRMTGFNGLSSGFLYALRTASWNEKPLKKRKKAKKRKNMLADILTFIGSSIYLCPKKRGDEI